MSKKHCKCGGNCSAATGGYKFNGSRIATSNYVGVYQNVRQNRDSFKTINREMRVDGMRFQLRGRGPMKDRGNCGAHSCPLSTAKALVAYIQKKTPTGWVTLSRQDADAYLRMKGSSVAQISGGTIA